MKLFTYIKYSLLIFVLSFPALSISQEKIGFKDNHSIPAGNKGQIIRELIESFNSNEQEKIELFLNKNIAEDKNKDRLLEDLKFYFNSFYRVWGEISFYSIRIYPDQNEQETIIIVNPDNFGTTSSIVLFSEDLEEGSIRNMFFAPSHPPIDFQKEKITEKQLIDSTAKLVDKLSDKDIFSGTILIAKGENILFEKACGEASKRYHVPNNIDTKFNLGSMNKMFTSVAIMQLVENNKIKLNDTINLYVDESWLPREITERITVHHLLTHTSGLGNFFNEAYWKGSKEQFRSVDDFKLLVKGDSLAFEPGEKFMYSNIGMLLLGAIIEEVMNMTYFDYVRENISKPAGMINSDCYNMDQPVENLAIGYIPSKNNKYGWENNLFKHVIKGGPAGGGFSTIHDLHKFALALQNETLLSQTSLNLLWKNHSNLGNTFFGYDYYGYGFMIMDNEFGKAVGHLGAFPGINSGMSIFPDKDYILVVLSNHDFTGIELFSSVREAILRTE